MPVELTHNFWFWTFVFGPPVIVIIRRPPGRLWWTWLSVSVSAWLSGSFAVDRAFRIRSAPAWAGDVFHDELWHLVYWDQKWKLASLLTPFAALGYAGLICLCYSLIKKIKVREDAA